MSEKTRMRTTEGRSPKGTGEDGSHITPEAILAELAKNAKKGGKA